MAPGSKRKKKVALNPARGVATTSIASKRKDGALHNEEASQRSDAAARVEHKEHQLTPGPPPGHASEVALQDGYRISESPGELERRLEQMDTRLIVDKLSERVRHESKRHLNRLRGEFHTLNSRVDTFHLSGLVLCPEVSDRVKKLCEAEIKAGVFHPFTDTASQDVSNMPYVQAQSNVKIQEENMIANMWILRNILIDLGYVADEIQLALQFVCSHERAVAQSVVWGFEEALDWLAYSLPEGKAPTFVSKQRAVEIYTPLASADVSDDGDDAMLPVKQVSSTAVEATTEKTSPQDRWLLMQPEDEESSDSISDAEPHDLLEAYINIMTRLEHVLEGSRNAVHLQNKLSRIQADILFDHEEAHKRWQGQRIDMARRSAQERRIRKVQGHVSPGKSKILVHSNKNTEGSFVNRDSANLSECSANADEESLLGSIFDMDMTESLVADTANVSLRESNDSATGLEIRDFGEWKGLDPLRILEDACRSRDAAARVRFVNHSQNQHVIHLTLIIDWAKVQSASFPIVYRQISSLVLRRQFCFKMQSIATPKRRQAEAYLASFALFQIFSPSSAEQSVHLRLPNTWKDFWSELSSQKQAEDDDSNGEIVKSLKELVRGCGVTVIDGTREDSLCLSLEQPSRSEFNRNTEKCAESLNSTGSEESAQRLQQLWISKATSEHYEAMLPARQSLPIYAFRKLALQVINDNQVTIIRGETGCGKSTQLPAYILEDGLLAGRNCKIFCTQPRRISAVTLAQRVSEELGESSHELGSRNSLIGYSIRLETRVSQSTRLSYVTTGVMLRMLESRESTNEISHIVVDEVHERSIDTDFLLMLLRILLERKPGLKVILMSATVDSEHLSAYFSRAPVIDVPGRTFPVETKYLEDALELTGFVANDQGDDDTLTDQVEEAHISAPERDESASPDDRYLSTFSAKTRRTLKEYNEHRIEYKLIVQLIEGIRDSAVYKAYSRAILVFLPGLAEIKRLKMALENSPIFHQYVVFALHSSIASDHQQQAFRPPPKGLGKLVLATNIAETGITIPDVTCVIDTGKHKEMRYDEKRQVSRLLEFFISRANAKQRRGRAGRVQNGLCFHLFSKQRHDSAIAEQQTPEMLRLSLQDVIMQVKACKLGDIETTLAAALDPPSARNVQRAIEALIALGALSYSHDLTPLGEQLSKIPLDPYLAKVVLFGACSGCLDLALTIAATLTSKSPFLIALERQDGGRQTRMKFVQGSSDILTDYHAYEAWRKVCISEGSSEKEFCRRNSLSLAALCNIEDLKAQLLGILEDAGFVQMNRFEKGQLARVQNSNSQYRSFTPRLAEKDRLNDSRGMVEAMICWSFYPRLLRRDGRGWRHVATNQTMAIHPTSAFTVTAAATSELHTRYLAFYGTMQSAGARRPLASIIQPITPLPLILLAGNATFNSISRTVSIDGHRLRFSLAREDYRLFLALKHLRRRLVTIMHTTWRHPGKRIDAALQPWWEVWESIFYSQRSREGK